MTNHQSSVINHPHRGHTLVELVENTLGETPSGKAKGFSENGMFRGQLITPYAKYTFNNHMFTRLMPAW